MISVSLVNLGYVKQDHGRWWLNDVVCPVPTVEGPGIGSLLNQLRGMNYLRFYVWNGVNCKTLTLHRILSTTGC